MRLRPRDLVLLGCILLFVAMLSLLPVYGQSLSDPIYLEGIAALESGDLDTAEARFRAILGDEVSHDAFVVEYGHLGLLQVLRARNDLSGFESELTALQRRNPESPVIDDGIIEYAGLCFDRGQYHFAAEICRLFSEDPDLAESEFGEDAALLTLRAYLNGHDEPLFTEAYESFVSSYPRSARRDEADLLQVRILMDLRRNFSEATVQIEQFLENHPGSSAVAEARMALGEACANRERFDRMFAEYDRVVSEHSETHPELAAEALSEQAIWAYLVGRDIESAQLFLDQAATAFESTEGGRNAARWLNAFEGRSLDGADFQYEVQDRAYDVWESMLEAMVAAREVVGHCRERNLTPFFADEAISDDDKAEQLYQVAYSQWNSGREAETREWAQRAIDEYPNTRHGRIHAPYLLVLCLKHDYRLEDARLAIRQIVSNLQQGDEEEAGEILFQQYSICDQLGDEVGMVRALTELLERAPDCEYALGCAIVRGNLVRSNSALELIVEQQITDLAESGALDHHPRLAAASLHQGLLAAVRAEQRATEVARSAPPEGGEPIAAAGFSGVTLVPGGSEVIR